VPQPVDFAFLIPSPPAGFPVRLLILEAAVAYLSGAVWGRVECRVPRGSPPGRARSCRGALLTVRRGPFTRPAAGLKRATVGRARRAARTGVRLVALAPELAGLEPAVAAVLGGTGVRVLDGAALELALLVASAPPLLRWRGVDPERARSAVVVDGRDPAPGEAAAATLATLSGRVGVVYPPGPRRAAFIERVRRTTGTILEILDSAAGALESADLVVLTGGPHPRIGGVGGGQLGPGTGAHAASRALVGCGGPAVILEPAPGGQRGTSSRGRRPTAVRFCGPPAGGPGGPEGNSPHDTWLLGEDRPLRVARVLFSPPPGWVGRAEPGVEPGLVSAALAGTAACALAGGPVPAPRRQP